MEPIPPENLPSDKSRCCLLVLCGIPASGKSTAAAALASAANISVALIDFDKRRHLISSADLSASPEFDPETWKVSRRATLTAVRQALELQTPSYHLVIVDDTMHYRSMRAECWRLARETGAAYVQIHLTCPLTTALARNASRPPSSKVPENVLRRTADIFEPPEESLFPWDKNTLVVDSSEESCGDGTIANDRTAVLWKKVWSAWGAPAPLVFDEEAEAERVAAARQATAEDSMHSVDVGTRRQLSLTLSKLGGNVSAEVKATIAKKINEERRRLLHTSRARAGDRKTASAMVAAVEEAFQQHCADIVDVYVKQRAEEDRPDT